jgi:exonuclease III
MIVEIDLLKYVSNTRICNIFFKHKNIHKYIWKRFSLNQKSIIDYIITRQKIAFKMQNARVKRELNCGLDHCAVICHIYFFAETTSTTKDPSQTRKVE